METNNNIEQSAKQFATIIKIVGIIASVILVCIALYLFADGESEFAIAFIIYCIVGLFSTFSFYYFFMLLINISLKLDRETIKIHDNDLSKIITHIEKLTKSTAVETPQADTPPTIKVDPTRNAPKKGSTQQKDSDKPIIDDNTPKSDDEIENEVLAEIIGGNTIDARYILMTKRNMSMKQADVYIERLKQDAGVVN